jgi:hypothetical protein
MLAGAVVVLDRAYNASSSDVVNTSASSRADTIHLNRGYAVRSIEATRHPGTNDQQDQRTLATKDTHQDTGHDQQLWGLTAGFWRIPVPPQQHVFAADPAGAPIAGPASARP